MNKIKAIETKYKGYRFRSRLEARWAVYFDALGIEWEYEYEGFELSNGSRYLPDFHLPSFNGEMWCEVKPKNGDFSKAKLFANDYEVAIWFCAGVPSKAVYKFHDGGTEDPKKSCGIALWDQAYNENRMFGMPCNFGCNNCDDDQPYFLTTKMELVDFDQCDSLCENAINAAKSARFEFGEVPLIFNQ